MENKFIWFYLGNEAAANPYGFNLIREHSADEVYNVCYGHEIIKWIFFQRTTVNDLI
jgi:hypothetical protein